MIGISCKRVAPGPVGDAGLKAISAAQKGGEPDKKSDTERLERAYLNSLNKVLRVEWV